MCVSKGVSNGYCNFYEVHAIDFRRVNDMAGYRF
jgi:hypothetical protein